MAGIGVIVASSSFAKAAPPPPRSSPIRWPGAAGRVIHGYMAIPADARGPQPAVLVLGEAHALPPAPDATARDLVDALASAGLLACSADNVTAPDDLAASLRWLRFNHLSTGRLALAAVGDAAATVLHVVTAEPASIAAVLLLGGDASLPSDIPKLALPWHDGDPALPPPASAFLKEHLR